MEFSEQLSTVQTNYCKANASYLCCPAVGVGVGVGVEVGVGVGVTEVLQLLGLQPWLGVHSVIGCGWHVS